MLISGVWHACDDGVLRPVIPAEVQTQDGSWIKAPFLLDTGADRTVLSADILTALRFPHALAQDRIWGIGGEANSKRTMASPPVVRRDIHPLFRPISHQNRLHSCGM